MEPHQAFFLSILPEMAPKKQGIMLAYSKKIMFFLLYKALHSIKNLN